MTSLKTEYPRCASSFASGPAALNTPTATAIVTIEIKIHVRIVMLLSNAVSLGKLLPSHYVVRTNCKKTRRTANAKPPAVSLCLLLPFAAIVQFLGTSSSLHTRRLMRRMLRSALFVAAMVILMPAAPAHAQTGTITGTVTDPAGGVLPGVLITITNVDTNSERLFVTDERGDYTVPFLTAGIYRVEAALRRFRTEVADKIDLSVDDY